jgi:hypothetical protein
MKLIKLTLIIPLFFILTNVCKAQNYGTLRYWGKDIKLDRNFFQLLNDSYSGFINNTGPNLRYYNFKDYQEIYTIINTNLTNPEFVIIVTEANQLQWENAVGILPGTDGEKGRSKKSSIRASLILYKVVLPALQQYYQYHK